MSEEAATKVCHKCSRDLPLSCYLTFARKDRYGKLATRGFCRECAAKQWKEWYASKPKGYQQARRRKAVYLLTANEFADMYERQEGLCAICQKPNGSGRLLCIDHDHTTGSVRGLLCNNCNWALGLVEDDPHRLEAMKSYLERFQGY